MLATGALDNRIASDPPKFASILGLGFGDCGKGLFTDFLCRQWKAHTVVRFNGGAQAGHNVVLPDGRHHTFSQFGSGTFDPGVRTVLASPVVVHPGALLVENRFLKNAGVDDALARLMIDGRCRINTPFHQAAGRLREILRGTAAHGTCGIGFGETVRHSLDNPVCALRYGDLFEPRKAREKLAALQLELRLEFASAPASVSQSALRNADILGRMESEVGVLRDETIPDRWVASIAELLQKVPSATPESIVDTIRSPGTVLFEGAQGILLDEWKGFHPHTTWSSTHAGSVEELVLEWGLSESVRHLGVLRTYLMRHGQGPLPTHDTELQRLSEPHNHHEGWQGAFRQGHPDAVLMRYALECIGPLSGILVSHLDAFESLSEGLKWCGAYDVEGMGRLEKLEPAKSRDLAAQEKLTVILGRARPCFDPITIGTRREFLERLSQTVAMPIIFGSTGKTYRDVAEINLAAN